MIKKIDNKNVTNKLKITNKNQKKDASTILIDIYEKECNSIKPKLDGIFSSCKNVTSAEIPIIDENIQINNQNQVIDIPSLKLDSITKKIDFLISIQPSSCLHILAKQLSLITAKTKDNFIIDALNESRNEMTQFNLSDTCDCKVPAAIIKAISTVSNNKSCTSCECNNNEEDSYCNHVIAHPRVLDILRESMMDKDSIYFEMFMDLQQGNLEELMEFQFHWISENWGQSFQDNCIYIFNKKDAVQLSSSHELSININDNKYLLSLTINGNAKIINPKNIICIYIKE